MSFLGELKRRKVFQVAAVYAVTAWLLIQIADTLLPAFDAPPWVFRVIVLALAMGFAVALILGWVYELTPQGLRTTSEQPESERVPTASGHRLNQITLTLLVAAVAFLVIDQYVLGPGSQGETNAVAAGQTQTPPATRSTLLLPAGTAMPIADEPNLAISDDGRLLAFVASTDNGVRQVFLRALNGFDSVPLNGTDNAEQPFFSPDGLWIGFWANEALLKVSVDGGTPIKIADKALQYRGASWGSDGMIYLGGNNTGLERVSADGGPLTLISMLDAADEDYHAWPDITPDGRHLLFTVHRTGAEADWDVAVLSLDDSRWRILDGTRGGAQPRYVESGHLVYARSGSLFAMPFDDSLAAPLGPSRALFGGINAKRHAGLALTEYVLSRFGTLVFLPTAPNEDRIAMFDRNGNPLPLPFEQTANLYGLNISPNGERVTFTWNPGIVSGDIWIQDLERSSLARLTNEGANIRPIWSPDGARITFASFGGGSSNLYTMPVDQSETPTLLLEREHGQFPGTWAPDGQTLLYVEQHPTSGNDIWALDNDGTRPIVVTSDDESWPEISPDGRWLAYVSDASGRDEVYVQALDGPAGRRAVSTGGGIAPLWSPQWSPGGGEIFYVEGNRLMSVRVEAEPALSSGTPEALFELEVAPEAEGRLYDVMPSGDRILAVESVRVPQTELKLVAGFTAELGR